MRKQPSHDVMLVDSKDVDEKLKSAFHVLKATYSHPYQAHGSNRLLVRGSRRAGGSRDGMVGDPVGFIPRGMASRRSLACLSKTCA